MPDTINRISSEAVKKATGKNWEDWLAVLDAEKAMEMTHREIASLLRERGYIENEWWRQMVATGYETARGSRVTGETAAAGFEIGVRRTFKIAPEKAWELMIKPPGLNIWLGAGSLQLTRGKTYETADGTKGAIRSITPGRRLRLTWQPLGWRSPSTLQLTVIASGKNTTIAFHQEKLPGEKEREEMRNHWQEALDRLGKAIEKAD